MFRLACSLIIAIILINVVSPQFNGDFWWLNDKVKKIHGKKAPPAQFEKLTGLETDESDKIVFRNLDVSTAKGSKKEIKSIPLVSLNFPDWNQFLIPLNNNNTKIKTVFKNISSAKIDNQDEFVLKFPVEENIVWESETTSIQNASSTIGSLQNILFPTNAPSGLKLEHKDKLTFNDHGGRVRKTESICTYVNEIKCDNMNGSVYKINKRSQNFFEVCCILPLEGRRISNRIIFPETDTQASSKRFARSLSPVQKALKQRTAIKQHINKRIITPENDDKDPYDNIRNYGQRKEHVQLYNYPSRPSAYDEDDDEFADELPRPGIVGLYSDPIETPGRWPFDSGTSFGESVLVDDDVGYGVPTLDPRIDNRFAVATKSPLRRKPPKSTQKYPTIEKGVERISYQSNPDFQVLQGFKLLNLMKNRRGVTNKQSKIGGRPAPGPEASYEYDAGSFAEKQVYEDCGLVQEELSEHFNYDDSGEELEQPQPWLALVVRKRLQQRPRCVATLVHPRAAITVASCVLGQDSSPGELSVYAGAWDDRGAEGGRERRQGRPATALLHPRSAADHSYDIALLHWSRPLKMSDSLNAVCLANPRPGETCLFVGWGDGPGSQRWPQQQRATILSSRECIAEPPSFCASINENFVGGTGAALVCRRAGRWAAVGVAARRDSTTILLMPLQEWTIKALGALGIA